MSKPKLLILEAEPHLRVFYRNALRLQNVVSIAECDYRLLGTAKELSYEYCKWAPVGLVLYDSSMKDVLQTIQKLRQFDHESPFVAVVNSGEHAHHPDLIEGSILSDILQKPLTVHKLAELFSKYLVEAPATT
jgi:DNA-binding response OmpR family regulator